MKSILLTLFVVLLTLGVSAKPRPQTQTSSPSHSHSTRFDPMVEIRRTIDKMFRDARIEEIETTRTGYKAEIRVGRKEMDISFDKSARWTETRYELRMNEVPARVQEGIKKSKYGMYKVDEVVYIENAQRTVYRVEFDRIFKDDKRALFTTTGRML